MFAAADSLSMLTITILARLYRLLDIYAVYNGSTGSTVY